MLVPISHIILAVVDHKGDEGFCGKTLLQKVIYFLNELLDLEVGFRPHYYGPYSSGVAAELSNLIALGFIAETVKSIPQAWDEYGEEIKRYEFHVAKGGKEVLEQFKAQAEYKDIKNVLGKLDQYSESKDYNKLSKAAKIHHIIKAKRTITYKDIEAEASKLNWTLDTQEIEDMAAFLEKLEMIKHETPTPAQSSK